MPIKLDSWVRDILVDPLSKEPLMLSEDKTFYLSSYGRKYPIIKDLCDFRLLNNEITADQKIWKNGQRDFEKWYADLIARDYQQDYFLEKEGVREVYRDISIEGCCLDVGGHQGRLREFIPPGQKYITCDPFINVFANLDKQPNLIKAYPFLLEPVNFVCCEAEFLPFKSNFFQTVHMRSVLDHLLSPELALNEAYRVLKNDGLLIVGLFVYGGKNGQMDIKFLSKEIMKKLLGLLGINKFRDHHVWHPTYKELINLISNCGFKIEKVHWQKGYHNTVCYVSARKCIGLARN